MNYYFDIKNLILAQNKILKQTKRIINTKNYNETLSDREKKLVKNLCLNMLELDKIIKEMVRSNESYETQDREYLDQCGNLRRLKE